MPEGGNARRPKVASAPRQPSDSVRRRLLRHPTRKEIVDMLEPQPGMNKNQIRAELDINGSLLDHHLSELERVWCIGMRESAQEQEILCFRHQDLDLWEDEQTRILFGRRQNRNVALYIADHPGHTTREIGQSLGLAPTTIRHHLKTLQPFDLVDRFRAGRTSVYDPTPELTEWVKEVGQGFARPWET